ncbi:hypothetical protein WN55_06678 [Dufourea novaeangliae]|uniref:Uncharacterized protein n=1 Tax=Dufourea novaeangliae TaxID=178035 RepID=A0A154PQV7_DUFNO|nr:hypothetical protein WN55_06678 [Dufourea novaeangliae]
MFDLQSVDTSVSSAAANFGEVGGPGLVKSTHTTSTWCPLRPLVASAAKGANGVCGVLGAPGAGVVAVVEQAAASSSSDDREDRLVGPQAAGFLLTTGERVVGRRVGRSNKINMMDSSIMENNVTAPGDLGALGAGAGVVVKQATHVSLSDDCGARLVDHQASGALTATGEGRGSNTPSEAVPGPSRPARPMTGGDLALFSEEDTTMNSPFAQAGSVGEDESEPVLTLGDEGSVAPTSNSIAQYLGQRERESRQSLSCPKYNLAIQLIFVEIDLFASLDEVGFRVLEGAEYLLALGAVMQGSGTAGYVITVSDVTLRGPVSYRTRLEGGAAAYRSVWVPVSVLQASNLGGAALSRGYAGRCSRGTARPGFPPSGSAAAPNGTAGGLPLLPTMRRARIVVRWSRDYTVPFLAHTFCLRRPLGPWVVELLLPASLAPISCGRQDAGPFADEGRLYGDPL